MEPQGAGLLLLFLLCLLAGAQSPVEGGHRPGFQPLSDLSSYEIVVPRRITRERRSPSKETKDKISFEITIEGKEYVLLLTRSEELVPKDFKVYTYGNGGRLDIERPTLLERCHYHGNVDGIVNSLVGISICFGLRGLIQIENITYVVEPLDVNNHVVYRMDRVKRALRSCPVAGSDIKCQGSSCHPHPVDGVDQLVRRKRGVLLQTRYVELFIVVDKERYMLLGQNKTAVTEEMVHLANFLDMMYSTLNIRIVLVGLEIWTFENKISLEGGAADVLANFVQWRERELVPRRRHDSAQLILTKGFGDVAGMAYVGTICSKSNAGGINVFGPTSVQMFASIVAHELGHNLGMNHDDERNCHCPTDNCIMKSKASGAKNFSSCSEEDFEKLTLNKGGSCLLNIPRPEEIYSVPYCGNKLVDAGEECDCGSPEECKTDPCCEAGTCKLRSGADCGYGDCCRNCHYLTKGTECREKASECDLPEYCNGTSAFCPQDVTVQNGHPCNKGEAYCYNGFCQYYEAQCQAIFGPKAKAAPEICFSAVNSKGDRFGNCGYHNYDYKKCSSMNSMCGKLQCENVKTLPVFGIEPAIIQSPIKGSTCWGVDFQLGSDVPDPGMVNEGTKCAPGKICKHYQCVDVAVLGYDCDINNQCNGQGVCNSNKNCHCNSGWAPPFCNTKGYGGSVDSGPPYNDEDTTTRNWLLAFFFLILPLLLTSVFCYCMRNRLSYSLRPLVESCCGCFSRSRNRRQEPVGSEFPPSAPYPPRDTASQMNMPSKWYPVPSYTVNQQPYGEPFHYKPPVSSPKPVLPSREQHFIPSRPPPPATKTTKTQEPLIPSRPAPLPPK